MIQPGANTSTVSPAPSSAQINQALERIGPEDGYTPSVGLPPLSYQWRQRLEDARRGPPITRNEGSLTVAPPGTDGQPIDRVYPLPPLLHPDSPREGTILDLPRLPGHDQPPRFEQEPGSPPTVFDNVDQLPPFLGDATYPRREAYAPETPQFDATAAIVYSFSLLAAVILIGFGYHRWRNWKEAMTERPERLARAVMIVGTGLCLIGLFLNLDLRNSYGDAPRWYQIAFEQGGLAIAGALGALTGLYFWLDAIRKTKA